MSELLFYGGIITSGVAVTIAIMVAIILCIHKTRLNKQLDAEYGKRRH